MDHQCLQAMCLFMGKTESSILLHRGSPPWGGYCHDPFLVLSPIDCICPVPLGGSLLPYLTMLTRSPQSTPTMPDQVPQTSFSHTRSHGQNHSWNTPQWLWGCKGLLRPHGHHMTIMQPCATHATSLAGHLAG